MRTALVFLAMAGFIACIQEPKDAYRAQIETYIQQHANDPSSYEPVEFSQPDTVRAADPIAVNALKEMILSYRLADSLAALVPGVPSSGANYDSLNVALTETMRPGYRGVKIRHRYRGKNAMGAMVISESYFYFDTKGRLSNVLSSEEEANREALNMMNSY